MNKLLIAAVLACGIVAPANAAIFNLGANPTSATGDFSNGNLPTGAFSDQYRFQLTGSSTYITFASATNDYVDASNFIGNFTGQLFQQVGAVGPGGGNDIAIGSAVSAVGCPGNPGGCQILAGAETLASGNYYLQISGNAGVDAGYGGNLTTVGAVPEPATWAMMILGFLGIGAMGMRKKLGGVRLA